MSRHKEAYVISYHGTLCHDIRGGSRGVSKGSMEPPFERASLTRDTIIEQSNRYTLIEQSQ